MGREVTVPANVESVVAIGPGALRLYIYAASPDMVVGVEQIEVDSQLGPALYASKHVIGRTAGDWTRWPQQRTRPEKLLTVAPDVIFSTYASDAATADELQAKTGIPVVVLSLWRFIHL